MEEEEQKLYKIEGAKFIAVSFEVKDMACPHCGKQIEMHLQLGTVEFKKPKGR